MVGGYIAGPDFNLLDYLFGDSQEAHQEKEPELTEFQKGLNQSVKDAQEFLRPLEEEKARDYERYRRRLGLDEEPTRAIEIETGSEEKKLKPPVRTVVNIVDDDLGDL